MRKLTLAFTTCTALATALLLSGTAQADVSDFASSGTQTTDRTSADEMDSDSDQYYSGSTDASESYSGAIGGSTQTNSSTLSRRAVPVTDFSGYRTLGSASVVDSDSNQTGSAFGQSTNQVPNPSIDTGASSGLGYGINQGNFTPNGGLSSPATATTSSASVGSSSTATISAP